MFRVHAEAARDGELGTRARSPAPSRLRSGECSGSSDPLAPDWEVESRRVRLPGLAQTCLSVGPRDSQGQGRLGSRCAGAVPGGRPQDAAMEKRLPRASVRPGVVTRRVWLPTSTPQPGHFPITSSPLPPLHRENLSLLCGQSTFVRAARACATGTHAHPRARTRAGCPPRGAGSGRRGFWVGTCFTLMQPALTGAVRFCPLVGAGA